MFTPALCRLSLAERRGLNVITLDLEYYYRDGMMGDRGMGCTMGVHQSLPATKMMMMQEETQGDDDGVVVDSNRTMARLSVLCTGT